jgi:hypothetical protein
MTDLTLEEQRRDLLDGVHVTPQVQQGFDAFYQALALVPAPVVVNTGQVRYSTGSGN